MTDEMLEQIDESINRLVNVISDRMEEQIKEIGYISGCFTRMCELYEMANTDNDTAEAIRELTQAVKELKR
jgi:hypothetical protein